MDVLITRAVGRGPFNVVKLDRELKNACEKVRAVSVSHHCDPHAVIVHCTEPVTPAERAAIEMVVESHSPDREEGENV